MSEKQIWNTLEVTKLLVAAATPLLLFGLGLLANQWVGDAEQQREDLERAQVQAQLRADAVRTFSQAVYGRRTRAEMLASALRRDARLDELVERKRLYDEQYVSWNTDHKANLLTIREIVGDSLYTGFEATVEFTLVSRILAPLDACLTRAYDERVRGDSPRPTLDACDSRILLQQALDCGHGLIEELYQMTGVIGSPSTNLRRSDGYQPSTC